MSEQPTEAPASSTEAEAPKPTETVEFWKQKAREQEKRAKDNAAAATELAQIRESQKSEAEKSAERLAALEADAKSARAEALRLRIAAKHSISDEDADLFLTGSDEETLTKQAQRLAGRTADQARNGNVSPREGTTNSTVDTAEREAARSLFASNPT